MSCYGWERGSVKLPVAEFNKVKKDLLSSLKQRNLELLACALNLYSEIKKNKIKTIETFIDERLSRTSFSYYEKDKVIDSLVKNKTLSKPKSVEFKINKDDTRFHDSDLTVTLVKEQNTIFYQSDDNNHSIEEARSTFLGRKTLNLLNNAKYTSHTGGYLQTLTEYHEAEGARISKTFGKYKEAKNLKKLYNL